MMLEDICVQSLDHDSLHISYVSNVSLPVLVYIMQPLRLVSSALQMPL